MENVLKIIELENNLVKVTPLINFDFEEIYNVASDPLIWEQHPAKDRHKRDTFENYFKNTPAQESAFLITDKLTNSPIGSTRFYDYIPENKSIAIGYTFLARKYWGGTYNKSIKAILIDYAFRSLDKVYFHVAPRNIRSQKAVLKIGGKRIGEHTLESNGKKIIYDEYLISKNDWDSVKLNLSL